MILRFDQIIPRDVVAEINSALERAEFVDGRETADNEAALAKRNLQVTATAPVRSQLSERITSILLKDQIFINAVMPKRFTDFHFSRYEPGMEYGEHMDNAFMSLGTKEPMRSDLSMTLFLADPESYEGGELVITSATTPRPVKLPAGSAIVYPTTDFHRVTPVTRGVRPAAVCWMQSMIREEAQRDILTEVWQTLDYMYKLQPPDKLDQNEAFKVLSKARLNLIRMWAEG